MNRSFRGIADVDAHHKTQRADSARVSISDRKPNVLKALTVSLLVIGSVAISGCASTKSSTISCEMNSVAPSKQPGSASARKALDAYLASPERSKSIPKSGFAPSDKTATRQIFVAGSTRIVVGKLAVAAEQKPVWVVQQVVVCP